MDRIRILADREKPYPPAVSTSLSFSSSTRIYPRLGPKKLNQLLHRFGTEMNVLHRHDTEELCK